MNRLPTMKLPKLKRRQRGEPAAPKNLPDTPDGAELAPTEQPQAAMYAHLITRTDPGPDTGLWAYYVLPGIDLMFTTGHTRERVYSAQMYRWAELVGHRVWLRGLLNPFPVTAYGEALTTRGGRPTPDGTRSWTDLVASAQGMLSAFDAKSPITVLGVQITTKQIAPEHLPLLAGSTPIPSDLPHLPDVRRALTSTTDVIRRDGFNGRPLSPAGLRWVVHASRGLGVPVPPLVIDQRHTEEWQDVAGFDGGVLATAGAFSPSVNVRALRDLTMYERHVVVQPCAKFNPRRVDDQTPPWLAWLVNQDDPGIGSVEYVAVGEIVAGDDLVGAAELLRRRAEASAHNWAQVGENPPRATLRGIDRAEVVEDEVANGSKEVAARFKGVFLVAVSGDTEAEALNRASDLRSHLGREQQIELADAPPHAQYALYRAFMPGAPETCDPAVTTGYTTQMPLYYLASAIPNGYATAGDRIGMPIGPVAGSTDILIHDPHGAPQRNVSGLTAILAAQGGGKSTLVGSLIDWSIAAGYPNVVTDPAGQMRRVCGLPWNKDDSYVYDLARARAGVAVPSLLVPEPKRNDYATAGQFAQAVKEAEEARRDVTNDVFMALLPYQLVMSADGANIGSAVEDVVREYGGQYGANPWQMMEQLANNGEHGARAARLITVRGTGSVFFPEQGTDVDDREIERQLHRAVLTVISMEGIDVPSPGLPRPLWSRQQQRSAPLLLVAGLLAMRTMYADRQPKQITMDELGILAPAGEGASPVLMRAATESRKWGATVNVVGQTPSMLTNLGDQVSNLVGTAFIGQMDEQTATECLPLLGLRPESGHAATVASLARGEYLVRQDRGDGKQTVRRVYVDRSWWEPELLDALDTTPGGGEGAYVDTLDVEAAIGASS